MDSFSLNRWLQINLQRHTIAYKEPQKKKMKMWDSLMQFLKEKCKTILYFQFPKSCASVDFLF